MDRIERNYYLTQLIEKRDNAASRDSTCLAQKNIIFPAFGKEQTAKGGVLYEDRMFNRWL